MTTTTDDLAGPRVVARRRPRPAQALAQPHRKDPPMATRPPFPPRDDDPSSPGITTRYDDRQDHQHMRATLNDRDRTRLEAAYNGTRPLGAGERHRWERTVSWYGEGDRALIRSVLTRPAKPPRAHVAAALAERYPTR